jgi:signal transduction histidine kinase
MTLRSITPILLLHLATLAIGTAAAELPVPLTRIAEIRRLSREDAAKALPVKISGVSLWTGLWAVVVDDGEQSIWVPIQQKNGRGIFDFSQVDCQPGSHLEIEGVTDPGGYAPIVIPTAIRRIGTLPIRQAKRVSVDRLLSGSEDGQRVEIEGVVQEFVRSSLGPGAVMLSMVTDGNFCRVFVAKGDSLDESRLVDARVRVRGILAPDHNARAQVVNLKLLTTSASDFDVLTRPPADPFQSPRVPLDHLAPFSPDAEPWHRKVTSGIVILAVPGQYFFLQDGNTSVRINSSAAGLKAGQRMDVTGFVDRFDSIASIKNAVVRPAGEGIPPEPLNVTSEILLDPRGYNRRAHAANDPACRMVRLSGRIQRIDWNKPGSPRAVWINSDERLFPAYLPLKQTLTNEQIRTWVPGAQAELTGVCELKFTGTDTLKRTYTPVAFHLLMPGPESVRILRLPPWWTQERMRIALAGVGGAALLLLSWTWLLRRQVARQSSIIGDKIANEAVHAERSRIARDLHDSIEQQLTGVSLHLYGAKSSIASDPQSAAGALDLARRMLKHTQRETRNSIRDLRSPLLENRGLAEALRVLAGECASSTGPVVSLEVAAEPANLTPDTEYQLLRLTQEALGNALKHADARHISLHLDATPEQILLTVTDDGRGFRPDALDASDPSHFGMLGMQERATKIGAVWKIASSPGHGTTVSVSLPPPNP